MWGPEERVRAGAVRTYSTRKTSSVNSSPQHIPIPSSMVKTRATRRAGARARLRRELGTTKQSVQEYFNGFIFTYIFWEIQIFRKLPHYTGENIN